jgi:glycerol-3-phosphate dehydrogenase (NAD(P)+)
VKKNTRIGVLGAGLWGTVLANQLSRKGGRIKLWEISRPAAKALEASRIHPNLPGITLAHGVQVTSELDEAVKDSEVLLFVLPSQFVRATAHAVAKVARKDSVVVNASKGIEPGTLSTMGEIIASELGSSARVYTLSGPSLAREVGCGIPTGLVLAGRKTPQAEAVRKLLEGGPLRVDWSADRKGVELGGSLKNVLAIGCGVLDGLKAGANTKAALIIQGMQEMSALIVKSGGRPETIYGLSGLGDLIATGTSQDSRNRTFGEKLGLGKSREQAVSEIPSVVEGIEASESARALCRKAGLKAPLIESIWKVVHRAERAESIVDALGFEDVYA